MLTDQVVQRDTDRDMQAIQVKQAESLYQSFGHLHRLKAEIVGRLPHTMSLLLHQEETNHMDFLLFQGSDQDKTQSNQTTTRTPNQITVGRHI